MDIDALFHRPSLVGAPLSLLLRLSARDDVFEEVRMASLLLRGRNPWDEIVVLRPGIPWPRYMPADRRLWPLPVRVRFASSGVHSPLAAGIAACRWPILLLASPEVRLTREKIAELIELLDDCDLVVGKRDRVSTWWTWPWEKVIRGFFGVPVSDPLCPVKVMRKAAVNGVVLQSRGPLADFELIAKLTFMTSLMDECPVESVTSPGRLAGHLVSGCVDLVRNLLFPQFWSPEDRDLPVRHELQKGPFPSFPAVRPSVGVRRLARDRFGLMKRQWCRRGARTLS